MKVLITMVNLGIGGTERALMGVLKAFHREDVSVTLLMEETDVNCWGNSIPANVSIRQLSCKTLLANALVGITPQSYSIKKRKVLQFLQTIIIHVLGHLHFPFYKRYNFALRFCDEETEHYDLALDFYGYGNFATAYVAKKVNARKKATWIHSITLTGCNRTNEFYSYYNTIYCVSKAAKSSFVDQYPEYSEKAEVLYNYMDIDDIRRLSEQNIDDPEFYGDYIIVSVGRLAPEKGYDISIQAARFLKERGMDFKWFLIGEGAEREKLQNLISSLNLDDTVILLGAKDNPMPYMKRADLYVQSSRNEGYGLTIMEALVLEKTVIASNIESFCEQIIDGQNGYLVENDPEILSKKIIEIYMQSEELDHKQVNIKLLTVNELFQNLVK